ALGASVIHHPTTSTAAGSSDLGPDRTNPGRENRPFSQKGRAGAGATFPGRKHPRRVLARPTRLRYVASAVVLAGATCVSLTSVSSRWRQSKRVPSPTRPVAK